MKTRNLLMLGIMLLAGCASLNTTTFRSEKLVADTARGAVHAWNQYYPVAKAGASTAVVTRLDQEQAQIYDASKKLGATLQVVENLRLVCLTNSANTNLTALQVAVEAATSQSGAIEALVKTFMGSQ